MKSFITFLALFIPSLAFVSLFSIAAHATVTYVEQVSAPIALDAAETTQAEACLALGHPEGSLVTFDSVQIWKHRKLGRWVARINELRQATSAEIATMDKNGNKVNADAQGWYNYESPLTNVVEPVQACLDQLTRDVFNLPLVSIYEIGISKDSAGGLLATHYPIRTVLNADYLPVRETALFVLSVEPEDP